MFLSSVDFSLISGVNGARGKTVTTASPFDCSIGIVCLSACGGSSGRFLSYPPSLPKWRWLRIPSKSLRIFSGGKWRPSAHLRWTTRRRPAERRGPPVCSRPRALPRVPRFRRQPWIGNYLLLRAPTVKPSRPSGVRESCEWERTRVPHTRRRENSPPTPKGIPLRSAT